MKKLFKFLPIALLGFCLVLNSCSEDGSNHEFSVNAKSTEIIPDYEQINLFISAFDFIWKAKLENNELNASQLDEIFLDKLNSFDMYPVQFEQFNIVELNPNFFALHNELGAVEQFNSPEEYKTHLVSLKPRVTSSDLSTYEKQVLINKTELMIQLTDWFEDNLAANSEFQKRKWGWWDKTKCALGTIGMAGGSALAAGLAAGAGCTIVLPIIGTVGCGTAGAVAGGVFGAMVGVATFC